MQQRPPGPRRRKRAVSKAIAVTLMGLTAINILLLVAYPAISLLYITAVLLLIVSAWAAVRAFPDEPNPPSG